MELHILEHRVRVLSLARQGLWLYTHPLIKLLFLPRRSRCAPGFRAQMRVGALLFLRAGVRRLGTLRGGWSELGRLPVIRPGHILLGTSTYPAQGGSLPRTSLGANSVQRA